MTQFRHVDQSSQVFEIGAFVVELSKIIMLSYVTFSQWLKSVLIVCPWKMNVSELCYLNREDLRTSKHCSQHASNETIDTPAFLHQRYQSRNAALIVVGTMEMGEYCFLEGLDLVLKAHEVRYSFVPKRNMMSGIYHENNTLILPLIRIVNSLQSDIFFVLK